MQDGLILASQRPAARRHLCDPSKNSALHSCDPITLSRSQTDMKHAALWENATVQSAVHPSILITACGSEGNCFAVRTILRTATQHFLFFSPTPLIYLLIFSEVWYYSLCVCWMYSRKKRGICWD